MVDMYVLIRFKMLLIAKIRVRIVINLICLNIIYGILFQNENSVYTFLYKLNSYFVSDINLVVLQ